MAPLWLSTLVYGPQKDIWFAAGCFWGAQKFFKRIDGVEFTEVGFANGHVANPSYEQVYTDTTGYAECVHVRYNPESVLPRLPVLLLAPFLLFAKSC